MSLGPPATRTECYLAAIHDRLGEILDRLDGGQQQKRAAEADMAFLLGQEPASEALDTPTMANPRKRTRTRQPRTAA
jgi:hypothetical protein